MQTTTFTEVQLCGHLKVHIKAARLTHSDRLMFKMSPFAVMVYHGVEHKTGVCHKGGKHPQWAIEFEVKVHDLHEAVKFIVLDHKMTHNDVLGELVIKA